MTAKNKNLRIIITSKGRSSKNSNSKIVKKNKNGNLTEKDLEYLKKINNEMLIILREEQDELQKLILDYNQQYKKTKEMEKDNFLFNESIKEIMSKSAIDNIFNRVCKFLYKKREYINYSK